MLRCSPPSRLHRPHASSLGNIRPSAFSDAFQRHQCCPWLGARGNILVSRSRSLASTFAETPLVVDTDALHAQRSGLSHPAVAKVPGSRSGKGSAAGSAQAFFSRSKAGSMADGADSATNRSKLLVVTGATKGLGRALVLELAKRGHRVAGCGRDAAKVEEVRRLLDDTGVPAATAAAAAASPSRHLMAVVDVASDDQVKAFAGNVISTLGVPDI
ncbi:hypothetical protein CLOM_g9274 [Closterium sp. NIES-68]|nr:hypothetical protein CLOM_g9274 [Closterium sp. NIES-68]